MVSALFGIDLRSCGIIGWVRRALLIGCALGMLDAVNASA
jgi:hypothetical protein